MWAPTQSVSRTTLSCARRMGGTPNPDPNPNYMLQIYDNVTRCFRSPTKFTYIIFGNVFTTKNSGEHSVITTIIIKFSPLHTHTNTEPHCTSLFQPILVLFPPFHPESIARYAPVLKYPHTVKLHAINPTSSRFLLNPHPHPGPTSLRRETLPSKHQQ